MESIKREQALKPLIWLYFWLLIFEGALRKWVFPDFSGPLLIVRDPILLLIYFQAIQLRVFPKSGYIRFIIVLAVLSLLVGMTASHGNLTVTLYGVRSNFLHLPLIFLIPRVFNLDDVRKIGKWILILALPMAMLMVKQFYADPESAIVQGISAEFGQISAALGKIRPPGTFSFITGIVSYYALVAAFAIYGVLCKKVYKTPLLYIAIGGLLSASVVSGSRSFVAAVMMVLVALGVLMIKRLSFASRTPRLIFLVGIVIFAISSIYFFKEGKEVLETRFEEAARVEADSGGMVGRFFAMFSPVKLFADVTILGQGVGAGTMVGAFFLTGERIFILPEDEWGRVMMESGILLGPWIILLRILIVLYLAQQSLKSIKKGNALPTLILGACGIGILNGQFGQPTTLGFAVFGGGLCLAACRIPTENDSELGGKTIKNEV